MCPVASSGTPILVYETTMERMTLGKCLPLQLSSERFQTNLALTTIILCHYETVDSVNKEQAEQEDDQWHVEQQRIVEANEH
jgi:hypothetical protein